MRLGSHCVICGYLLESLIPHLGSLNLMELDWLIVDKYNKCCAPPLWSRKDSFWVMLTLFGQFGPLFWRGSGFVIWKTLFRPWKPELGSLDENTSIGWVLITAVGSPTGAESAVFGFILMSFWQMWATFMAGDSLCELRIPSLVLKTLIRSIHWK